MKERERLKFCGRYFGFIIRSLDIFTICFIEGRLLVDVGRFFDVVISVLLLWYRVCSFFFFIYLSSFFLIIVRRNNRLFLISFVFFLK